MSRCDTSEIFFANRSLMMMMIRPSTQVGRVVASRAIGGTGGRAPLARSSRLQHLLESPPPASTRTATTTTLTMNTTTRSNVRAGRTTSPFSGGDKHRILISPSGYFSSSSHPSPPSVDRQFGATAAGDIDDQGRGVGVGAGVRGKEGGGRHHSGREDVRRSILTHALHHVHDMGWTDDAIASGTLDAGLPPSYVGFALSSSSSGALGNADLVAFFMDECNTSLSEKLASDEGRMHRLRRGRRRPIAEMDVDEVSSRINVALRTRLSMVLPYVASRRWHEGMAIGALPQNALGTMGRLNDMAEIVLGHALGGDDTDGGWEHARRAAIVAAYVTAEFHLLSSDAWVAGSGMSSSTITSLSGERHRSTWTFLGERSAEAARLIVADVVPSSLPPLPSLTDPDPNVVMASAAFSSLVGAALSLASPSAAATVGTALPRAMDSALGMLRGVVDGIGLGRTTGGGVGGGQHRRRGVGGGTRPSDYDAMESTATLPPFDSSEEIFPRGGHDKRR
jgi:rpsU-divergently transcribed protein